MPKKQEEKKAPPPLQVGSIFETHLGVYDFNEVYPDWKDYNAEIIQAVMKERIDDPEGVYRSNSAGTWHSTDTIFDKPVFHRLRDEMARLMRSYIGYSWNAKPSDQFQMKFQTWAMMYTDRGYATYHTHPNCHLSSVYFCHDGPQEEITMATGVRLRPGDLEFVDTRSNAQHIIAGLNQQPAFVRTPKAGTVMIFPSWLPHFVHPVAGEKERISIASNMTILKHIRKEPQDGS